MANSTNNNNNTPSKKRFPLSQESFLISFLKKIKNGIKKTSGTDNGRCNKSKLNTVLKDEQHIIPNNIYFELDANTFKASISYM